jgi:hypothetical protein
MGLLVLTDALEPGPLTHPSLSEVDLALIDRILKAVKQRHSCL